jgi:DNA-binding transcriptional LysR family regulator
VADRSAVPAAAEALVAAGEGIALLPRIMLQARHRGVVIRPLAGPPADARVGCSPGHEAPHPASERFLELLVKASADHATA